MSTFNEYDVLVFTQQEWELLTSCGACNERDGAAYWVDGAETDLDAFYEPAPSATSTVIFYGN